ncbi:DUF6438 domain-containing protein [Pseudotenacibaculum sp. MALMAid0570]|uniref:DUF6438 domain-containing protein n=1 Tax=Pseudotenacibaculum sp. MALMAid0570 TaxID=3143938 RepID=UPI0032DEA404
MKKIITLFVFALILNVSCNSAKQNSSEPYIQLTKKRCFGKCPVYDLFIYRDGLVKYNGIDHVSKKGRHQFKISKDKLVEIESLLLNSGLESLKDPEKRTRDLPVTHLSFQHKTVLFQGNDMPEKIKKVIKAIESLVVI